LKRALDDALAAINVLPPTYEPGATGHGPEIIEIIEQLVARGHAYAAEDGSGDVYFDVRSWPQYGDADAPEGSTDMEPPVTPTRAASATRATSRCGRATRRRPSRRRPAWPSPGARTTGLAHRVLRHGRKYLGPAFDVHGGGVDLRFPHHENEQAQSRAAGMPFASYWLHNAWITTRARR
jgi:cysteinyl-tRNA synthetase